jgi:hypothetical protein
VTTPQAGGLCSYETFGARFFELAVTEARVAAALSGVVGDDIEFGPVAVGPGRVARASATGRVLAPTATRTGDRPLEFVVRIPVDLRLTIELGGQAHRFTAGLVVPLRLTVHAAEPLLVVIHIEPPSRHDIELTLDADGVRATFLQFVAGVDEEIRRVAAKYVAREVARPSVRRATTIDLTTHLDAAWPT